MATPRPRNRRRQAEPDATPRPNTAVVHPELGPKLAALRQQSGLTMAALARLADVDTSMISRLEAGERNASRELIERLADAVAAPLAVRHDLLVAGGYLTPDAARLLDDPDLSRLAALLTDPALPRSHHDLLMTYVRLALAHADAIGLTVTDPGTAPAEG
jgi:transcriptional regulator with XRE-family HTH domain